MRTHGRQCDLCLDQTDSGNAAVKHKLMRGVVARLVGVIGWIMLVFMMAASVLRNGASMCVRVRDV